MRTEKEITEIRDILDECSKELAKDIKDLDDNEKSVIGEMRIVVQFLSYILGEDNKDIKFALALYKDLIPVLKMANAKS